MVYSRSMLKDIGHPFARSEPVYDVTFENVQAGERTSHLFRLANLHNALVVGGTCGLRLWVHGASIRSCRILKCACSRTIKMCLRCLPQILFRSNYPTK